MLTGFLVQREYPIEDLDGTFSDMRLGLAFVGFPKGIFLGEALLEFIDRRRELLGNDGPRRTLVAGVFTALLAQILHRSILASDLRTESYKAPCLPRV